MTEERNSNNNRPLLPKGEAGKRYYVIAGEASGDLHGSNLLRALRRLDGNAQVRAWGGDLMAAAGAEVVKHYRDLAFMGFIEVLKNLPTILRNLRFCKEDIAAFRPDVLVLIDYPGFNLRIAKWAKAQGLKVVYYISPQVWAWKEGRVKSIRQTVDKMLVILPFEKAFYEKWNYPVTYVGHPLVDVVETAIRTQTEQPVNCVDAEGRTVSLHADGAVVALLPGSRRQEIVVKLPVMLAAAAAFPQCRFVVAAAPSQPTSFYQQLMAGHPALLATAGQTYALLTKATAALVTSGTATLETALFGVPQVVCYKGSAISYQIAKRLVTIKYISLVNLIMDKAVVTELIQDQLTPQNIQRELAPLLADSERRRAMKADYRALKELLQQEESASAKAAQAIVDCAAATAAPPA